jgi:hypothetical protein
VHPLPAVDERGGAGAGRLTAAPSASSWTPPSWPLPPTPGQRSIWATSAAIASHGSSRSKNAERW